MIQSNAKFVQTRRRRLDFTANFALFLRVLEAIELVQKRLLASQLALLLQVQVRFFLPDLQRRALFLHDLPSIFPSPSPLSRGLALHRGSR